MEWEIRERRGGNDRIRESGGGRIAHWGQMHRAQPKYTAFFVRVVCLRYREKRRRGPNVKEARSGDLDGVRTHVSRGCEKGIRTRMPSARTTTASVLGSRSTVGRSAGRGLGWEVRYPSGWRRQLSVTFRADTKNGKKMLAWS